MSKYDSRCLQLTVRRNTAFPQLVDMQHIEGCCCIPSITILHTKTVVINRMENGVRPTMCPCGEPCHKGMCKDAILEGAGRVVPKWKAM